MSVIIPVRNEEQTIARTLLALKNQTYANFEVIVVNDHSSDDTITVVMQNKFPSLSILHNREVGKKSALQTGVEQAKGELIVTTDGDCCMNERWLESIYKTFTDENVVFAFGAVAIQPDNSFFSRIQAVEFASLIGSGAATSSLGLPTMSNGANLAFLKSAFLAVNGYEGNKHIPSGDDEFLMRKLNRHFRGGIKFIPYRTASVTTQPQATLAEFIHQRLRWAGKWKYNSSIATIALAIFVFITQITVVAGCISLFISFTYSIALLLLIKVAFEASFIIRVCKFSKTIFSWPAFLILQIIYPFYVIFIGVLSNFVQPSWKGRNAKKLKA